jgi:hypothetical protein
MRKTVRLGDLPKGRGFWYAGRRYKVVRNLGAAGVSVRNMAEREVTVGDRTFTVREARTEVWAAGSPVEVEARG